MNLVLENLQLQLTIFEIRNGLIKIIQQSSTFFGDPSEDPHRRLIDFLELVETIKYIGVSLKEIKAISFFCKKICKNLVVKFVSRVYYLMESDN